MPMPETAEIPVNESLAALVTIVRAARLTGDTALERVAQRKLWDRYRIRVAFGRPLRAGKEADRAR
jgi:hypothetical protein